MTKISLCLAAAVAIAIVAIVVMAQRQAKSNGELDRLRQDGRALQEENENLRQQIAQVQAATAPESRPATTTPESRPAADASELERLRKGETELLRLRNEVGQLRDKLNSGELALTEEVVLKGSDRFDTNRKYRPPVEITLVAKTDSTNLRLAYAATQIIFNWEQDQSQLRVNGGPADGLHKAGAGLIPAGDYVNIKWIVTEQYQEIYVNGESRYRHEGDYSQINRFVSVFPALGSTVTLKGLQVQPLTPAPR
jgi:hypothetical protein